MTARALPALDTAYALTDAQVAGYRSGGFVRLTGVASAEEVAARRRPIAAAVG